MVRVRFNDAERALLAQSRAEGTVLDWRNGPAWGQRVRIVGQPCRDEFGKVYWLGEILQTRGFMRAGQTVRVYPATVRAVPASAGSASGQGSDRAAPDHADHDQAAPPNAPAEGLFSGGLGPGDPQPEQALQLDLGLGPAVDASAGASTSAPDPLDPGTARAFRDYEALQILTRLHYDGHHLIAMGDRQGQRAVTWLATAGLVASRADEHGNAVLAATEAGERAIRAHVDRLEATLKRPVDVAPGDLIQPPGRPGAVVQVQQVRRGDDVVRMSGVFIDAHSAGLPAKVDWHLNGREDGWPTVPLSQDPRNGERIAHLNSVPGEYLLALARLQAVDTRLGATRPYFRQAVELIHDAMDHGAPPQEALPRVATHLRAVADRPTGTATQRRDLPPERADGIRRLAAELDQVVAEVPTSDGGRLPAAHEPRVQAEPSPVVGAGGPVAAANTAEEIPTTGDDLMTASRPPAEPGPATTGTPITAAPVSAGRAGVEPTSPDPAALDPVEASAGRYAGWFADPAKIAAAVTSWNGITSPDRRRRLRDHGVAAPAGYAWDDDHALHPAPAAPAADASAGGGEVVGTDRDDLPRDTAVPVVGRNEPIGVTDGRDEQGIRGPGARALEDVPTAGLQPDPGGGAGGLLPGVGVSGTRADHRTGGQPGGPGRAGGERPGQAGPAEQRPRDGRGAGDQGAAAAGTGDEDGRILPGAG
ncbi:MAG TPA: hypothetical protein VFP72_04620, partial [Kineosporiaceae bacterium]|nr:hypothetical protein [Kineosporiaceae bacterium]